MRGLHPRNIHIQNSQKKYGQKIKTPEMDSSSVFNSIATTTNLKFKKAKLRKCQICPKFVQISQKWPNLPKHQSGPTKNHQSQSCAMLGHDHVPLCPDPYSSAAFSELFFLTFLGIYQYFSECRKEFLTFVDISVDISLHFLTCKTSYFLDIRSF